MINESNKECAIYCENVSKEFYIVDEQLNWRIVFRNNENKLNSFQALTDISLKVPKGKFVGILGRNGAGKSTLLRVLGKVYSPTAGIINATGEVTSLFEMGGLGNNRLTGFAYANRFLEIYGINKKKRQSLVHNIHEFSELGADFFNPIYSYSSGMSARLFFATATEIQHKIYLVDELLSVGDEHFQAKCWKRLRERFTNGASGILVTHDWSAVLRLCEYSYILNKGKILASGNSDAIVQTYLNLPLPTKEYAEIMPQAQGYTLESGQNAALNFSVFLKKMTPVALSYSIEVFRGGYGWEIIMMSDYFVPINCKPGMNEISIKIKALPLVEGSYYFNIFLKSLDESINSLSLDTRSWTYGNGIKLRVQGKKMEQMVVLPWHKQIRAITHVST
jgi:lipopolysaccharide transport system ATP-binding protein